MEKEKQSGFTLIELAIVLVIIGLIVGGVLVGQDLIKAAQIRAVTTDIDRYNTAANAFQTKYGGIPGDLLSTKAQNNGLCYSSGVSGAGDGTGLLSGALGGWYESMSGENLIFWLHLSQAQMIPFGPVGTAGTNGYPGSANANECAGTVFSSVDTTGGASIAAFQAILPTLRLRENGFIHVFGYAGLNYYLISNPNIGAWGDPFGNFYPAAVLTPREAQGIDQKLDDGYPDRGTIYAVCPFCTLDAGITSCGPNYTSGSFCSDSAHEGVTACYDNTTKGVGQGFYMTSTAAKANTIICTLAIRASF